jgi:DNA (cytosine-5)-methyltransferase 1
MTHGSLFSGIGGFDLAARNCGITNVFQVEIDEFCQKVLTKNFPKTEKYKDIYEFDGTKYRGEVDIISGGFPCQPFSVAGLRKGGEDERALFPEMLRVISEVEPSWVIAENVYGIVTIDDGRYFEEVLTSLEAIGYEVQPFIIPASAINAPHKRDRVWIVAQNTNGIRGRGRSENSRQILGCESSETQTQRPDCESWDDTDTDSERLERGSRAKLRSEFNRGESKGWQQDWYEVATRLCRVDDGVSDRVHRLKALGNAIVPQIAEIIFKNILKTEKDKGNE